ncbi:MAG TPA: DNA/RNA nuclease SfsA [Phenylobacterium sp.]|nr:DNA/RNA nuclease SfsA [Phenylobacterium sp.]
MRSPGLAEFPDCVAARSLKHLRELTAMVAAGQRAVMLFVVQRTDCDTFAACADLDPAYARRGAGLPLCDHSRARGPGRPRPLGGRLVTLDRSQPLRASQYITTHLRIRGFRV